MALNRVSHIDNPIAVKRVLMSVSDKTGLENFALGLLKQIPEIIFYSTGGTFKALEKIIPKKNKDQLIAVSDYTGQPEMQGGLVKTLDFKIYLGLLSETYNTSHQEDLKRTNSVVFDMVVVNLYPFRQTIAQENVTLEDARTNIDIGGPCMLRASAKNFLRVASVSDPQDYPLILQALEKNNGALDLTFKLNLAKKTFSHTAAYDAAIADFLSHDKTALDQLYNFNR